mmetsp:Transcript_13044/g.31491  ORF Transcript_13044/g.31491 Transcript_13044/m.31491 type:complete len:244 (+) Transcript_13044:214-945(+)
MRSSLRRPLRGEPRRRQHHPHGLHLVDLLLHHAHAPPRRPVLQPLLLEHLGNVQIHVRRVEVLRHRQVRLAVADAHVAEVEVPVDVVQPPRRRRHDGEPHVEVRHGHQRLARRRGEVVVLQVDPHRAVPRLAPHALEAVGHHGVVDGQHEQHAEARQHIPVKQGEVRHGGDELRHRELERHSRQNEREVDGVAPREVRGDVGGGAQPQGGDAEQDERHVGEVELRAALHVDAQQQPAELLAEA